MNPETGLQKEMERKKWKMEIIDVEEQQQKKKRNHKDTRWKKAYE